MTKEATGAKKVVIAQIITVLALALLTGVYVFAYNKGHTNGRKSCIAKCNEEVRQAWVNCQGEQKIQYTTIRWEPGTYYDTEGRHVDYMAKDKSIKLMVLDSVVISNHDSMLLVGPIKGPVYYYPPKYLDTVTSFFIYGGYLPIAGERPTQLDTAIFGYIHSRLK